MNQNKVVVMLSTFLCFAPMVFFCAFYSINVPISDQWAYFDKIFGDPVSMFFYQYAHHRMGFGGVVLWLTSRLTHFNICAINYVTIGFIFASTLLALKLQEKLNGANHWKDIVIPICMLTLTQSETFVINSSLLQVAAPEFLLLLYVIGWISGPSRFRVPVLAGLQFLILFSGYGETFFPVIMGFLFLRFQKDSCALPLFACGALASATFFFGLNLAPIEGAIKFDPARIGKFLMDFAPVFSQTKGTLGQILGGGYLAALSIVLVRAAWRVWKGGTSMDAAIFLLSGCVLAYSIDSAICRVAVASRYMTITSLGFASIFMASRRNLIVSLIVSGVAIAGSFTTFAHQDQVGSLITANRAEGWLYCYQSGGDWKSCSDQVKLGEWAQRVHLGEKLDFMRQHKLGFFAEVKP